VPCRMLFNVCFSFMIVCIALHGHCNVKKFLSRVFFRRNSYSQTTSREGSVSVASGCDVAFACAGVQTDEKWTDAAAETAAAETIEGLQRELVSAFCSLCFTNASVLSGLRNSPFTIFDNFLRCTGSGLMTSTRSC
jgi:hypothetical protein